MEVIKNHTDDVLEEQSVDLIDIETDHLQLENYDIIQSLERRAGSDPQARSKSKKKVVF